MVGGVLIIFIMGLMFPHLHHSEATISEGLAPSQRSLINLSSCELVIFAVGEEHFVLLFPAMVAKAPVKVGALLLKHGFALWVVAVDISTFNKALATVTAKLMVNVNATLAGLVLNPATRVVTKIFWWTKGTFISRI